MLKKKWLWVSIVIVVFSVIGGKVYMNKKEERNKEKEQIEQAQKELSIFIVQHYTDVKKIEFKQITYNNMTGTWSFGAEINDKEKINFTVVNLNEIEDRLGIRYNPNSFKLSEKTDKNKSIEDIEIILGEVKK